MTDASRVIATDDQAALSKASCVKLGYWEDEGLLKLIPKAKRRSPIINAGYFVRFKVISDIVNKVLNTKEARIRQFLILGAGSDTMYWRLNLGKEREDIKWFEIDFEKNLNYKSSVLEKAYGKSNGYFPVPADLRNIPEMEKKLVAAGFDLDEPTFVLSEVVLAYLNSKHSTNVIKWIGERLHRATFCEFEQINPDSTFGNRMITHFQKMGSPILTIQDLRTLSSREERLKEHFKISSICPIYPLAPDISDIEPFDEFEVLHLYMKHYYIGFGTNCSESADELSEYFSDNSFKPGSTESSKNSVACEERIRFPGRTFSGYQIDSKRKFCVSGLGVDNESSAKQDNVSTLVEIKEESAKTLNIDADEVLLPQVVSLADKLVVFGGRKNPRKPNQNLKVFRSGDYGNIFEEKSEVFGVYRSAICTISESSFLCFGGRRADGAFSNKMVEISVEESGTIAVSTRYIEFEEELPRLASATCSKLSDTEFEIIGGLLPNGKISDEILRIRIDGSKGEITWRRKLDFGIYGHSIHICESGNRMLIIGGISTLHEINDAVIEMDKESWKIMSIKEMSSKELLLVGNGARVTKESENQTEIEIIGGGAHCFAFGNHLNPLIATISF